MNFYLRFNLCQLMKIMKNSLKTGGPIFMKATVNSARLKEIILRFEAWEISEKEGSVLSILEKWDSCEFSWYLRNMMLLL